MAPNTSRLLYARVRHACDAAFCVQLSTTAAGKQFLEQVNHEARGNPA
jgi:hypothetical protein